MRLRLLCLSDVHSDVAAARRLGAVARAADLDAVVSAGDLGLDGVNDRNVYEAVSHGGVPVLSVPGNHDGDEAYDTIATGLGWTDLHGRVVELQGWWLAGFGLRRWDGAHDAPDDPELAALLSRLEGVPPRRLVLVTHVPPRGTLAARDRRFVDRGSDRLAGWLSARQPAACVCGHVHHREVVTELVGETLVVNAGPHGHVLTLHDRG